MVGVELNEYPDPYFKPNYDRKALIDLTIGSLQRLSVCDEL